MGLYQPSMQPLPGCQSKMLPFCSKNAAKSPIQNAAKSPSEGGTDLKNSKKPHTEWNGEHNAHQKFHYCNSIRKYFKIKGTDWTFGEGLRPTEKGRESDLKKPHTGW